MADPWLYYHFAVLAVLVLILINTSVNVLTFPELRKCRTGFPGPEHTRTPLVSILIPARNEEHNIGRCAESLRQQDYPNFEILVLDDCSDDGTARVVCDLGFSEAASSSSGSVKTRTRFLLLRGRPLPAGWAGKPWACHQLATHARGAYLLFTDADTWHAPGAVSAAVAKARSSRADLLSVFPLEIMITWSEKLVLPMIHVLAIAVHPAWLVTLIQRYPATLRLLPHRRRRDLGAANGQFLLFPRESYDAIGGHRAVRHDIVEDVALGRAVIDRASAGLRLINCDGAQFVRCRMYRRFSELWEGFSKNMRLVYEGPSVVYVLSLAAGMALFCAPFFFLLAVPGGKHGNLILSQVILILTIRTLTTIRFSTSWWSVVLHPVAFILATLIALNSWRLGILGKITWKSREYDPLALR